MVSNDAKPAMNPIVVLCCPGFEEQAHEIRSRMSDLGLLVLPRDACRVVIERYRKVDGAPKIWIEGKEKLLRASVFYLCDPTQTRFADVQMVLMELRRYNARTTAIVPWCEHSTDDRHIKHDDAFAKSCPTAPIFVELLKIALGPEGTLVFVDPHSTQMCFFGSGKPANQISVMPDLIDRALSGKNNVLVATPDCGAEKRFGDQIAELRRKMEALEDSREDGLKMDVVACGKNRDPTTGAIRLSLPEIPAALKKRGRSADGSDWNNKRAKKVEAILIDDIGRTLGTALTAAEKINAATGLPLSLLFAHADFDDAACERVHAAQKRGVVADLYVSDSNPRSAKIAREHGFVVVSIAGAIAGYIGGVVVRMG